MMSLLWYLETHQLWFLTESLILARLWSDAEACTSSHHHQSRMKWMGRGEEIGQIHWQSVSSASFTMSDVWMQPHSTHHWSNSWALDWSSRLYQVLVNLSFNSLLAVWRSTSLSLSSLIRFSSLRPEFLKLSRNSALKYISHNTSFIYWSLVFMLHFGLKY